MKRIVLVLVLAALAAAPTFGQLRLDMGISVPRGAGVIQSDAADLSDVSDAISKYIIPIPELGLSYQFEAGPVRLSAGVRCFTFILVSVFWPNATAEVDFGRFTLMGQVGGGWFGVFGLVSSSASGKVFFPELSLWYRFGENFRLGVGGFGVFLPEMSDDSVPFVWYLGGKFSFVFR